MLYFLYEAGRAIARDGSEVRRYGCQGLVSSLS